MKHFLLLLIFTYLLAACHQQSGQSEDDLSSIDAPPSYLSFRIDFPMAELEDGVNKVLPATILNDAVPMKNKDSLYLVIKRKGRVTMTSRSNEVFATIPLEVEAVVKKTVLGVTLSNEDAPIVFEGEVKAAAKIDLDEDWNMDLTCQYQGFDLTSETEINILGLSFNVDGMITKALDKHQDELSDMICKALNGAFDFRKIVNKVWLDVQNPLRIAQKPTMLWLYSEPISLHGKFIEKDQDTLSVHVEYRTNIHISPDRKEVPHKSILTKRGEPINTENNIVAYPKMILPYDKLSENLKGLLVSKEFSYEGYQIKVREVNVGRRGQKLKLEIQMEGDLNGKLIAMGVPTLTESRELVLSDFSYEIEAEDDWIQMADFAVHQFAEQYVERMVKYDINPFFGKLDQLIMDGLDKSKLGPKMEVDVEFEKINSYQIRLTDHGLEWIFFLEGGASMTLKNGLFKKPS